MSARLETVSQPTARGMLFVHSASAALCPHIEWAAGAVLGARVDLEWTAQPAEPGTRRAELSWTGPVGTGAALASGLGRLGRARFEVTEEPTPGSDGQRYSFTPTLGAFSAVVGVHGDILVRGERRPMLACCMDQCMVDVTGMEVQIGEEVTLFGFDREGNALLSQDVANFCGANEGCALTSALSPRVERIIEN